MTTESLADALPDAAEEPLEVVEAFFLERQVRVFWDGDDAVGCQIEGRHATYSPYFRWDEGMEMLQFSVVLEQKVPVHKVPELTKLIMRINGGSVPLGHFAFFEGSPMFLYALPLRGAREVAWGQVEEIFEVAVHECDRFHPAIQHVIWGGMTADEAFNAACVETMGEA